MTEERETVSAGWLVTVLIVLGCIVAAVAVAVLLGDPVEVAG